MPLCYAMPTEQCIWNEIKVLVADVLRPSLNILLTVIVIVKLHINVLINVVFTSFANCAMCTNVCSKYVIVCQLKT